MVTLRYGTSLPNASLGDFCVGPFELATVRVFTPWKLATDTNERLFFLESGSLNIYQHSSAAMSSVKISSPPNYVCLGEEIRSWLFSMDNGLTVFWVVRSLHCLCLSQTGIHIHTYTSQKPGF